MALDGAQELPFCAVEVEFFDEKLPVFARGSARFAADVSDPADVARLKTAVETELGRPTVLVNAAGIFGPIALVKDSDPKEWIERS